MKKVPLFIFVIFLVVIFTLPNFALANTKPGIKPGSFFYVFDIAFEKINLFFTFNSENKVKKALEYADERLAEAEALAEEKNSEALKTAVTNYENNISFAMEKSKEVKNKEVAKNLLALIADNTLRHQGILADVLNKAPDETKETIIKVIETSKKERQEATQQIAEINGEVKQSEKEIMEPEEMKEIPTNQNEQTTENKELKNKPIPPPVVSVPEQTTTPNNIQPQTLNPTPPSIENWPELENKYFVEATQKGWTTLIITNALGEKRYYRKEGNQWVRKNSEAEIQQPYTSSPAPQEDSTNLTKEILASAQEEINRRSQQRKQDINKIIEISNKYSDLIDQRDAEAQNQAEQLKAEYIAKGATFLKETDGTVKPMELLVGQQRMLHSEYYAKLSYIWDSLSVDLQSLKMKLNNEMIANWPTWASSPPIVYAAPPKIELFTSTERYIKINTSYGSSNWEITPNSYGGYYMQSYSFGKSVLFNITPMGNGEYYVSNY